MVTLCKRFMVAGAQPLLRFSNAKLPCSGRRILCSQSGLTNRAEDSQDFEFPEDLILGENFRPAFATTRSACLDLFFQVLPCTSVSQLHQLLSAAWQEDPATTVKLIFHMGNIREGGKQDQKNYYRALMWLHDQHPNTLLLNAQEIPNHSCLKCILNLLMFVTHPRHPTYGLEGFLERKNNQKLAQSPTSYIHDRNDIKKMIRDDFAVSLGFQDFTKVRVLRTDSPHVDDYESQKRERVPQVMWSFDDFLKATSWASPEIRDAWNNFIEKRNSAVAERSKTNRRQLQAMIDKDVRLRLRNDSQNSSAKSLFDIVTNIFVEGLSKEIALAAEGVENLSGLYAKWAPTRNGMHDKATRISEAIAKKLADKGLLGSGLSSEIADSVLAQILARDVLTPLRARSKVPEHFVGVGAWNEVDYNRMASRCRLLWGEKVFRKHDTERYDAFLARCKEAALKHRDDTKRISTVKSGALLPDEVLHKAMKSSSTDVQANLQWRGLVEKCITAAAGQRLRMVPVCDVSGSMSGRPMRVAIALSLLLCESAPKDSPWHGKLITFSETPYLVEVPEIPIYKKQATEAQVDGNVAIMEAGLGDLRARAEFVQGLEWGMNTDLDRAMDLLLQHMIESGTTSEEASQLALVIFSDMEFDEACSNHWETAHDSIARKFQAAGFGPNPPLVVYWNLRGSESIPVQKGKRGTILLSGYSAGMMRAFLEGNLEDVSPIRQMQRVLDKPVYEKLQVAPEDL